MTRALLALPLLAACAAAAPPGRSGLTLAVEGAPVPLYAIGEITGEVQAIQSAWEGPALETSDGGRTVLVLPAITRADGWDYGFSLAVTWDAWPPLDAALRATLAAAPARDELRLRWPPGADGFATFVAAGDALSVTFEALDAEGDGTVTVRAAFDGRACREDAPADCLTVSGRADLVARDRRRAPGEPAPPPILLKGARP